MCLLCWCFPKEYDESKTHLLGYESTEIDTYQRASAASEAVLELNPEKEMVLSEKRYLEQLKILLHEFLYPLLNERILPQNKQNLFVQDIKMIYGFHKIFYKDLKSAMSSGNIPELFIKEADFLKLYTNYVENYTQMMGCLAEFRKNREFEKFTKSLMKKNLFIDNFLIVPIQRVPRYELLLREMMRKCKQEGPEFETISLALAKVRTVSEILNKRKHEFELVTRMYYLISRIWGLPPNVVLYDRQRKFLDEEVMARRSKYDDCRKTPCHVLLFSDIIVTTDLAYKYKRLVQLSKLVSCQIASTFKSLIFKVLEEKDFILYCTRLELAKDWKGKVLHARDSLLSRTRSRTSALVARQCSKYGQSGEAFVGRTGSGTLATGENKEATWENLPILPVSNSALTNTCRNSARRRAGAGPGVKEKQRIDSSSAHPSLDDYDI